jgi:hypothetical protein
MMWDKLEASHWYRALLESGLVFHGDGDPELKDFAQEWSFLLLEFIYDMPIDRKPY